MDSSRGGPLTTFIMTLPLIVIPALALLRPADQEGSLLHSLLSAGTRAVNGDASDSVDGDQESDPFADLFSEVSESSAGFEADETEPNAAADPDGGLDADLFAEAFGDSAADEIRSDFGAAPKSAGFDSASPFDAAPPPRNPAPPAVDLSGDQRLRQLLGQLKAMGAERPVWFSPGNQTVGFAAFFQSGKGMLSYRFSAVADSHAAAVADVIAQARRWQGTQTQ